MYSFGVPFDNSVPYRFYVEEPLANGIVIADPLFDDGADRTNVHRFPYLLRRHRIGELGIDLDARIRATSAYTEDLLAGRAISNELDAALAEDASVPFQPDFVRGVILDAFGNWYGKRETIMSNS